MAENTAIEWADATVNFWAGCSKVSPACDHCYAERMAGRLWGVKWGAGQPREQFAGAPSTIQALERKAQREGRRLRVFINSLSDVFDNEVPEEWRSDLFDLIQRCENLDFLLLTKRVGNVKPMMIDVAASLFWMDALDTGGLPDNVWLGATICNQEEADRDIPKLLSVPAAKRFLSIEPMLGPVDLNNITVAKLDHDTVIRSVDALTGMGTESGISPREHVYTRREQVYERGIDWVICGGESGPKARPMHPDWVRSLRDQCNAAGVAFHFKQWGEWAFVPYTDSRRGWNPISGREHLFKDGPEDEHTLMERVGKKAAGRLLDGREWSEVPA